MKPVVKVWLPTAFIIAGILVYSIASKRILIRNTGDAFNSQQLALVQESAKGITESLANLTTELQIAADVMDDYPGERLCSAILAKRSPFVTMLFIVDTGGTPLFHYPAQMTLPAESALACRKALDARTPDARVFITDVFQCAGPQGARSLFVLGVKIRGVERWLCSIADFGVIKEKFVYPLRSAQTGYAWMINRQGKLLAHPNKQMEGRTAVEVLREIWPGNAPFTIADLVHDKMIPGEAGSGEYTGWHMGKTEPTRKLISYCPIDVYGLRWSLAVSAPYYEVMAPLMDSIVGLVVFLSCFIVIIVVGACMLLLEREHKRLMDQELNWSLEVFDGITDGISIIDLDYKVLMVNRAVSAWQGKDKKLFKGKHCYEVFQQQQRHCQGCPAREVFATGRPAFRKRVGTMVGDQKYYFDLTAFPLRDSRGHTVKVAELVKDVTREEHLQAELLQHERKAMIVKMASQIAHEIRNPLGALTLNIDLLEDEIAETAGAEAAELLDTIKAELDGLNKILQEYLECARFPSINQSRQAIGVIIEDLFGLLEEELRQNKIVFNTSFEYNLPMAFVDPDQIRRAFLNIIRNAMEAMDDGGGTIEVAAHSDEFGIAVVFTDSGTGMPDELLEKIFTPFYTTKSGGTGLGLSITQHVVAEHKGKLVCESCPGSGTTFTIHLPRWEDQDIFDGEPNACSENARA